MAQALDLEDNEWDQFADGIANLATSNEKKPHHFKSFQVSLNERYQIRPCLWKTCAEAKKSAALLDCVGITMMFVGLARTCKHKVLEKPTYIPSVSASFERFNLPD